MNAFSCYVRYLRTDALSGFRSEKEALAAGGCYLQPDASGWIDATGREGLCVVCENCGSVIETAPDAVELCCPVCGDSAFRVFQTFRLVSIKVGFVARWHVPGLMVAIDVPASAKTGMMGIHYTTDGSDPTLKSPVYTEPIRYHNGFAPLRAAVYYPTARSQIIEWDYDRAQANREQILEASANGLEWTRDKQETIFVDPLPKSKPIIRVSRPKKNVYVPHGFEEKILEAWESKKRKHSSLASKKLGKKFFVVTVIGLSVAIFVAGYRHFLNERNWNLYADAECSFEQKKFEGVRHAYDSMCEIPLLGISRDRYFTPGFVERLECVSKIEGIRNSIKEMGEELSRLEGSDVFAGVKHKLPDKLTAELETVRSLLVAHAPSTGNITFTFDDVSRGASSFEDDLDMCSRYRKRLNKLLEDAKLATQDAMADVKCEEVRELQIQVEQAVNNHCLGMASNKLARAKQKIVECKLREGCADEIKWRFEDIVQKMGELDTMVEVLSAKADAMAAEGDAKRENAEKWAPDAWAQAQSVINEACVKYEDGDYSNAYQGFCRAKKTYDDARASARENSRPRVKIIAKFKGEEKDVTIVDGGDKTIDDVKTENAIVLLQKDEIGTAHRFKIEYEYEENYVRYVGAGECIVENGMKEVEIDLDYRDTLKPERRGCGHCGASLQENIHVYKCPFCGGVIKKHAFMP